MTDITPIHEALDELENATEMARMAYKLTQKKNSPAYRKLTDQFNTALHDNNEHKREFINTMDSVLFTDKAAPSQNDIKLVVSQINSTRKKLLATCNQIAKNRQ